MKPYVQIEDDMPGNQKVRDVTVAARWAYVSSICYAGHNQTDGLIPSSALALVDGSKAIAAALVLAGLWEKDPKGWRVHDYLKHNRSRAQIKEISERNRKAGGTGLAKRYGQSSEVLGEMPGTMARQMPSEMLAMIAASAALADPLDPSELRNLPVAANSAGKVPSKMLAEKTAIGMVMDAWTNATGQTITRQTGDAMDHWIEAVGVQWVLDAIAETGGQGIKAWKYTAAILERWQRDGRDVRGGANGRTPTRGSREAEHADQLAYFRSVAVSD